VFATAVAAGDTQRVSLGVRRDDGVLPIELAGSAVIFQRIPGTVTTLYHGAIISR